MAETALSMARSILGSAITKAATAAAEEMSLLMGVQKEIWFMKDELKTMQAFLTAAEAMKKKKPLLKVWAEQVRSLSYDIEDCLDEFMVHVGSQSLSKKLMKLKDRHRIAVLIRNLKSRVEEVSNRNTRYNLIETEDTNIDEAHSSYTEDVRYSDSNIDEAQLVGFDNPKQVLLGMINTQDNNDGQVRVICVVGMGGLGKTTLVRKIYDSKEGIMKNFSCFAWITVSQSFSKIEMLKDMIMKLLGHDSLKRCLKEHEGKWIQVGDLASYLREELKEKRYFVVLDDLWEISDWNWIRSVSLPTSNNRASQIIVTTRNADLAKMCTTDDSLIYRLEPLKEEHAIELLLMKLGKRRQDMETDEKLKAFVKKFVKRCGYLPLAIITIGAMFATKHQSEWDRLYIQLPSQLENNLSLEAIKNMVLLSYSHLPSHLKPCFLYLSIFPEDFEIQRKRLVNRWIAEGFVRGRVGMTLEDVGKSYFNELLSRSMIQPSRVNLEGTVKSCRVHDIMRDIIVSLSREEGFVYTSGDNVPGLAEDNYRHVAYHVSKCSTIGMDWGCVRSLTVFGERPVEHAPSLCSPQLRMIRVLDLGNTDFAITQKDISNIGLLRHLQYVDICSLSGYSSIYALPRSIGKLQGLQTLKVSDSYISTLPTEICKLKSLCTLYFDRILAYEVFDPDSRIDCLTNSLCLPMILIDSTDRNQAIAELHMAYSRCWSETTGVKVPRGIGNLKELQILGVVDIRRTSSKAIGELGELSKLRKLSVDTQGATEKKCVSLCKAIQKLSSLDSLRIFSSFGGTIEWLDSVSSPPPVLRTLHLRGRIGYKVDWFRDLTQLVKLRLGWSALEEGKAVEIIGALPNLMLLVLLFGAYAGKALVFGQGAFLNLRELRIWISVQLREIRFEEDTSPRMESITIGSCNLELGINGIKHLPNLKEISLHKGSKVARLCMLQDEVNAHPNQPVLRLSEDQRFHDLGDPEGSDEYFDAMESLADHDGDNSEAITLAENTVN